MISACNSRPEPPSLPFLPGSWRGAPDAPALHDDATGWHSYASLAAQLAGLQPALQSPRKQLVFCLIASTAASAATYLAAAQSGHATALIDPALPQLPALIAAYQPAFIIAPVNAAAPAPYQRRPWPLLDAALWHHPAAPAPAIHPETFLLLLTSGSTGGGKFVRLSYKNIAANTRAIIASLTLEATERAFLHLPLSYSFGLSVLHTQLAVGGSTVLTATGMMERGFWEQLRTTESTLFPGVPYHYTMLARLGLNRLNAPLLNTFLQAGGRLDPALAAKLNAEISARPGRFFIMYGQTEAAPRLTCLPAHARPDKIGTAGQPLPGGAIEIRDGEIICHGPNIMQGYCTSPADLAAGDQLQGALATGDLGSLDNENFLTITGRRQRFAKLYGVRLALDDLEQIAARIAPSAILEGPEQIIVATTSQDPAAHAAIKQALLGSTSLQPGWLILKTVAAFPYRGNGKLDYPKLMAMLA